MSTLSQIFKASSGNVSDTAKMIGAGNVFKDTCNVYLVEAYHILLSKKTAELTWEEDTFTANFAVLIESIFEDKELPYSLTYQQHQITKGILEGTDRPQTAKKMDIVFATFSKPKLKYGIEAKIISENNAGTRNANYLCKEYIISGIDRFTNKTYDMEGCMIGYVINGLPDNIIMMVNKILIDSKRNTEELSNKHTIVGYDNCYQSTHLDCSLQHFLFQFA